jgi:hypothetical protein
MVSEKSLHPMLEPHFSFVQPDSSSAGNSSVLSIDHHALTAAGTASHSALLQPSATSVTSSTGNQFTSPEKLTKRHMPTP